VCHADKLGMRRLLLLLAAICCATFCAPANAEPVAGGPVTLRIGAHGQPVKDLQWLLSGHKPSVYRTTIRPYHGPIDGLFGRATRDAVRDAKWRLGYPKANVDGAAGPQLLEFLRGQRARPLQWIGRAAKRVNIVVAKPVASSCSARIVRAASGEVGVHEVPMGSNDGPRVHVYQAVTGAFRLPWCASFTQWDLKTAGVGTIADRSASVFYIVSWSHRHELVHALPRPGALVAFLRNLGHIGVVVSVTRTGFFTVEGNSSDAVSRRYYPLGYERTVFIYPSCS
jgi:hypothetical protein